MQQDQFVDLVKQLSQLEGLPQALEALKQVEDQEVAEAAQSLTGQFSLAEIEGEQRIYHVFTEKNEEGEDQEFVEYVMNQGDDVLVFVSWFFYAMFEIKQKETYQAAGRTYQQPKRR
ncbi:hypothetical protein A3K86_18815 [Photobacterium jeanii]|uniref:Uncharacterized protein n=1 Tax=Photobacterium jeanii TaxID=858640 RepID=A0A178K124_9GAMM|nr:hypothetical protein [Photobacterium jeanii]OAN11029.1 hypothetical protein A3K86_18815 [Photobacterium jeanii]PST90542.1 hypothetical protein C9I91_07915 [Photobacterium jeanii]